MDIFQLTITVTSICVILAVGMMGRKVVLQKKQGKKLYHPIAGTVFHQLMNFSRLQDYMTELAGKYKTYRLIGPFGSEVYTSDPANVEYMLKTNFENYGKGYYHHTMLEDLLGDGIFTVDGEKWREQRKASSHEFSTRVLRDFSSVVFRKNAVKLANLLSESAISDQPFDIQDIFSKSTLDSMFQVSFGMELDSMCGSNEEAVKFSSAFDEASALTSWRYVDLLWKVKKALNVGSEAKLKRSVKTIDDFVYKLISIKADQMNDSSIYAGREDILSRFMKLNQTNPKYLRDIILNLVIAGKDTTATTLSWFIYMLCKHPDVQEKVSREVRQATYSKEVANISEFADRHVTEQALEKMHYLHAALTETLRLYPPVPVDGKVCLHEDTMPDGFSLKEGQMVVYQPYAMGRMRFIWGDDAQDFKPERWLTEEGCFKLESPFKFTAFQGGPRICLGKEFAYRQMKIFAAVLLRYFIFKLHDERKVVKYKQMLSLQIDGGLSVNAFYRSN